MMRIAGHKAHRHPRAEAVPSELTRPISLGALASQISNAFTASCGSPHLPNATSISPPVPKKRSPPPSAFSTFSSTNTFVARAAPAAKCSPPTKITMYRPRTGLCSDRPHIPRPRIPQVQQREVAILKLLDPSVQGPACPARSEAPDRRREASGASSFTIEFHPCPDFATTP